MAAGPDTEGEAPARADLQLAGLGQLTPPDSGRHEPIYSGSCTDPRHRPITRVKGQSSQMSPVSVIVANPCRVRSRLAVPVIVVILLSW